MTRFNEADFVLRGKDLKQPDIVKDGLQFYYDTKGKHNSHLHRDTLLDMSGQGKDGELSGFDYDSELSGYDGDSGLVFDGIDDTLVLGDVEKPEIISATRNLFDGTILNQILTSSSGNMIIVDHENSKSIVCKIEGGKKYTLSKSGGDRNMWAFFDRYPESGSRATLNGSGVSTGTAPNGSEYVVWYVATNESQLPTNIQIEEGSTATPYVPYIPTAKMTYQLNNNVISYGEGGTVKWVKDGKVMERKGINISTNRWWNNYGGEKIKGTSSGFIISKDTQGLSGAFQVIGKANIGDKVLVRFDFTSESEYRPYVYYDNMSFGRSGEKQPKNTWGTYFFVIENKNGGKIVTLFSPNDPIGTKAEYRNIQIINLTATFGAGNEPTLEEIQADPDKWQWLPNPMDLLESKELGWNILGDMEDIVDASPRDSQSGKEVFTEHADDSHVEVEVDGKSYQHAGSGKNLLHGENTQSTLTIGNPPMWRRQGLGVTHKNNYIEVETTGDIGYEHYVRFMLPERTNLYGLSHGTYVISGEFKIPTDYSGEVKFRSQYSVDGLWRNESGNGYSGSVPKTGTWEKFYDVKTIPENAEGFYDSIEVSPSSNVGEKFEVRNLQFERGSTATPYEPPAPTPDYPIEIHSLNDFDVVSSVGGRNLVLDSNNIMMNSSDSGNGGLAVKEADYVSITPTNNGNVYAAGANDVKTSLERIQGETYTVSLEINTLEELTMNWYASDMKRFNDIIPNTNGEWAKISHTYIQSGETKSGDAGFLWGFRGLTAGSEVKYRNLKLEKGDKATDWTPAPEDITPDTDHPLIDKVNLSLSEPLRSVGDVKDRLFRDGDGLWKIERNVGEKVFDGSEFWAMTSSHGFYIGNSSVRDIDGNKEGAISNKFKSGRKQDGWNNPDTVIQNTDSRRLYFYTKKEYSTIGDWRNYLSSEFNNNTPLVVHYWAASPIIETLDQELQDKLNTLKSFKGSNYIYTVQNTDSPHKEQLKPTLHATFNSKDYLKETRTLTNLLIWARELTDEELIHHNQLFLNRFNLQSDTVSGEPIEQILNLLHGGMVGHSLEQNYTINI